MSPTPSQLSRLLSPSSALVPALAPALLFALTFAGACSDSPPAHTVGLSGASVGAVPASAGAVPASAADPAARGWPIPYDRVSDTSIAWLKAQGWWPLSIGYFADVPGYSAHMPMMKDLRLLEARGLEVTYSTFQSGPPILEAFLAGQTQVTHYGDFPFWNTVDKGVPAVAYGLTGTNVEAALLVRPDSPLQSAADLARAGKSLVIGTTLGSYCEFYLLAMGAQHGLVAGDNYRLAGMSMREAQLLPGGIDAVAVFDPHVTFALEKGLGRRIDDVYPYYFNTGFEFMRREIHENAPDVAQALADASIEALLAVRHDPDRAAELFVSDPRAKAWTKQAARAQIDRYLTLYKPTYKYLHATFWATEDARVVAAQHAAGRLKRARDATDLAKDFAPAYLAETFGKLGWTVPEQPVFLPDGWTGTVGTPPYPPYDNASTLTTPQAFPGEGDLVR